MSSQGLLLSLHITQAMAPDRGGDSEVADSEEVVEIETLSIANIPSDGRDLSVPAHLSHDPATNAKRTDPFQFGQRYLKETDDIFEYNAWDHVTPDDEHYEYCESQYAKQKAAPVSDYDKDRFNSQPEKWWDLFYKQKTSTFFKDRKWLVQEFPVLNDITRADAGKRVLLEVGAGAGNTAFPIMRLNENPELEVIAADFSKKAVETMRSAEDIQAKVGKVRAEVWDVASEELPEGLTEESCDVVVMIFIFSALSPQQWQKAVLNVARVLKPGGFVLFRDYGRGDLAQVRFKAGRWMEDNFYVRGDGTRVYFFETDQLKDIWGQSFNVLDLDVDRRLIVNRQRRIKMFRCWIQGRFQKAEN
jgi:tRNAThr (cytosine32-N3)-methyltransferase